MGDAHDSFGFGFGGGLFHSGVCEGGVLTFMVGVVAFVLFVFGDGGFGLCEEGGAIFVAILFVIGIVMCEIEGVEGAHGFDFGFADFGGQVAGVVHFIML